MGKRHASSGIFEQVEAFIRDPASGQFDEIALAVFRYQFASIPTYKAFCVNRRTQPDAVRSFAAIPFASTLAFKHAHIVNEPETNAPAALTFKTSGTTKGYESRGVHWIPRPEIYRMSAVAHLRRMLFPDGQRMPLLVLHPVAERMPESSLSWMLTWCIEEFGREASVCVATPREVDFEAATGFLRMGERSDRPVGILGTTAAFARLFESLRGNPVKLPMGSRLMDTGGAKGQAMPLNDYEVRRLAVSLLGIEADLVINEYGMTELCSQLYDVTPFNSAIAVGETRMKLPPHWMRPVALDPVSLSHLPDGQVGLMAFFDLANVGSISAVMTEDFGYTFNGAVAILGRAAASDPRGCALGIDQFAYMARKRSESLSAH